MEGKNTGKKHWEKSCEDCVGDSFQVLSSSPARFEAIIATTNEEWSTLVYPENFAE